MKNQRLVYQMIICAIFAALAFVGTMVQIPLPSGGMIHLGNFICVLAGLLCGPVIGGLAGGVGCGLYDLIIYSSLPGFIQYFILKFIMGFIVGYLFRLIVNHKKKLPFNYILMILGLVLAMFTSLVLVFYNVGLISLSKSIEKKLMYIIIVTVFGYLFSILLILAGILSFKLKTITRLVVFVTTISVIVNIVLEFIWKLFYNMWIESLTTKAALIKAVSTMPSCILTGSLTVVVISLIYYRIYLATKNLNHLNEIDVESYMEDLSNE